MELTRKDISLFPTQHGFLFLGILTAMLLGSVNYNNNAGFILVFLLGSMAMISLAISFRNLTGIKVTAGHPHPVFKGQTAFFPMEVTAPDTRGQALSLFFTETDNRDWISVPPSGSIRTELPFKARARGVLVPGTIHLTSVFPLGLFRLRARIPGTTGVLVYPEPESGPAGSGRSGRDRDGEEESRIMGPDDFQGLTPYVPGSPVGHISWKTLSRGKGLFIKNFTAETGQEILFDLEQTPGTGLEQKLSILCSAILEAEAAGIRYGLKLGPGQEKPPESGSTHMHSCLKALALYGEAP